ncbi:hypothetical protein COOONC_06955 [Cooperia oncophora]
MFRTADIVPSVDCGFSRFIGLTSEQFMKNVTNEPVLEYKKGSAERIALEKELEAMSKTTTDVPIRIGNRKIFNENIHYQVMVGQVILNLKAHFATL